MFGQTLKEKGIIPEIKKDLLNYKQKFIYNLDII